jgi:Holliday junction resolvasome RuvABC endonuclease subunit
VLSLIKATMILALDASTTAIGFAALSLDADTPQDLLQWGTYRPQGELWDRLVDGGRWLRNWLAQHGGVPYVAIEIPILATYRDRHNRERRNVDAFRRQARMVGVLGAIAHSYGSEIIEVNPTERLTAIGLDRHAKKADVVKVINAIYGLSLRIRENDTADAVAIAWAARRAIRRGEPCQQYD